MIKFSNKMNKIKIIFLLQLSFAVHHVASFDYINFAVDFGSLSYSFVKEQTFCRMVECCNEENIPGDITKLKHLLEQNLFGQHLVVDFLVPALQAHFNPNSKSKKPLVITFHGTPGTGKNFVTDMIAESLYKHGIKSKYVHKYMGRADFPLASDTEIYKERINTEVRESIAKCPRSLFIFDEVDKMPPGIFESLTSLVDYNSLVYGLDITKAIFIFMTNSGGVAISNQLGELLKKGMLREDTKLRHFEQILEVAAYNVDGGMQKTSLIDTHVIDHYFPFLPLEKVHVYKCLEAEFKRWSVKPDNDEIINIFKYSISFDPNYGIFATSGCKTLEKKVAAFVMKNRKGEL